MPEVIPVASHAAELKPLFDSNVKLHHPTDFAEMAGFTNLFVVIEQAGKSWVIDRTKTGDKQTALVDLSGEVRTGGGCGLLGIAFHPKFPKNRKYYLKYQVETNDQITTRIVERKFDRDFKTDSGEQREIIRIPAVTQDHTGGAIAFGPDGFLYIGMGDTGPQNDPQGHAQDMNLLLGKILRIDVDHTENGRAYKIPKSNPFRKRTGVRPEIWACGFREPWRISFDPVTGDLWVGDVGQDHFEEVTLARAGENHGWNVFEGVTPFSERYRRAGEKYVPPVFTYPHQQGVSITGGFVYRGRRALAMDGRYICGDFGSRRLWALTQTNRTLTSVVEIGHAPAQVVSFAEDSQGELYIVGFDTGLIYKMDLASVNLIPAQSERPAHANLSR
jgi:glucose/arabinose dehydrogenase